MPAPTLLDAVAGGRTDAVRELLRTSPDLVHGRGPHPFWGGRPQPLHLAIEGGHREIFDALLTAGADVNGRNDEYDHWSPLMVAIQRERHDMRDTLLARGARVGLVEALMLGDDDAVAALLERGGLPSLVPNGGSLLAFARTPAAIDLLVARGAPLDAPDRWGVTPAAALSKDKRRGRDLVARLASHGATVTPADHARLGDRDALARLAASSPAILHDDSVMMAAVDGRHCDLVEWLLQRGASAQATAPGGARQTALHTAAWNGDVAMVALLVGAGALVTARDAQYGATPGDWAATAIEVTGNPRCAEVVDALRR